MAEAETTTTTTEQATTETKAAETTQATETKAAETTTETKAAETKAAETKVAETKETKTAETTTEAVDYAKTIAEAKLPEGVVLDPAASKAAVEMFGEMKLTSEQAGKLTAFYAAQVKAGADQSAAAFAGQVEKWKSASLADKDVGGAEGMGTAKAALAKFFDADTMKILDHFGLTNHPGFIKGGVKMGKAIKDDTFIPGDAGSGGGVQDARKAFPNSKMNP